MENLKTFLDETEDNNFFEPEDWRGYKQICSCDVFLEDKAKQICKELNELLLRVKNGEIT